MSLVETLVAEPPPLHLDDEGTVRIGETRVTLDTVITAFNAGCTPEEIREKYPTLLRADVYSVIAYYLRHPDEVEEYLLRRRDEAARIRREIEQVCPPDDLGARLRSRRTGE
jgi:uncharacterized protein (DUF433 family)